MHHRTPLDAAIKSTRAHAPLGARSLSAVQSNRSAESVLVHYGTASASVKQNNVQTSVSHRSEGSRTTRMLSEARNASTYVVGSPLDRQAQPTETLSLGGTTRTSRLDGLAVGPKPTEDLVRAVSRTSNDRSTPIPRAMTPTVPTAARWAPSVQYESNREIGGRPPRGKISA
jgi:hypothetical protein